jgi:hypothetical protein
LKALYDNLDGIWSWVIEFFQLLVKKLLYWKSESLGENLYNHFNKAGRGILEFIGDVAVWAMEFAQMFTRAHDYMTGTHGTEVLDGAITSVTDFFANAIVDWSKIWQGITDWFSGLWTGIANIFKQIGDWLGSIVTSIKELFGGFSQWLTTIGEKAGTILNQVWQWLATIGPWIGNLFNRLIQWIVPIGE